MLSPMLASIFFAMPHFRHTIRFTADATCRSLFAADITLVFIAFMLRHMLHDIYADFSCLMSVIALLPAP